MNARKRIALGLSSSALVLGTGAGIAAGAGSGSGGPPAGGGPPGAAAIATYLGLTSDQLRADLGNGQTLAQLATAQGKTVSGLESAILADVKTRLDTAVADGKLTAAEEATRLANLQAHVADLVNSTGPPGGGPGGPGGPGGGPATKAIADYLGLTADQIRTQLESGEHARAARDRPGEDGERSRGRDRRRREDPPRRGRRRREAHGRAGDLDALGRAVARGRGRQLDRPARGRPRRRQLVRPPPVGRSAPGGGCAPPPGPARLRFASTPICLRFDLPLPRAFGTVVGDGFPDRSGQPGRR